MPMMHHTPRDFPANNSEAWLGLDDGGIADNLGEEHRFMAPVWPAPRFDPETGQQVNRLRWDPKSHGYLGTDRMT